MIPAGGSSFTAMFAYLQCFAELVEQVIIYYATVYFKLRAEGRGG